MNQVKSKKAKGKNGAAGSFRVIAGGLSYFFLFTFAFCLLAEGQDDPPELAPPPLKVISRDERGRLDQKTDLKERTKLSLELMNARLVSGEKFAAGSDFDSMFRELGVFHALLDDSLAFLGRRDNRSNKVLDNFKRLELGFRGYLPRLEIIRRDLPLRYDDYLRKLVKYVREARTRATEPMFGETVVPNRKPKIDL